MLIQRGFIIQYVSKEKYTPRTSKKYTAAAQHTGKATRTTQFEEGKERVMSNAITQ